MKKTFLTVAKGRSALFNLLSVVMFALFFTVGVQAQTGTSPGQGQIIYNPTRAISVIESLNISDPLNQQQGSHDFGNASSAHGGGSATVDGATEEELLTLTRRTYYTQLLHELEIESNHNNTIAGTVLAVNRTYDRLLPDESGNSRYTRVVQIHNEILQVLSN